MFFDFEDSEHLFRITAPHFCAGFVIKGDSVILIAPIIKYMKHWSLLKIKRYCNLKNWELIEVECV